MATPVIEKSGTHTRSLKYSFQHTWVIDNFSNFYFTKSASTDPEHPCILSTSFNCSQEKRIQFSIKLYPKGDSEVSKDYISVYLRVTFKEAAKIPIKYKFSILNARNKIGCSAEGSRVFNKTSCWGWDKFIERKVLLDKKPQTTKGLLPDDKLTLLLEVDLYSEPVLLAITSQATGNTCLENLKSLSITKNGQLYRDLLESGYQSDVVLMFDGRKELKAHKIILSAHSPVFKAMFEADMKEKAEGRVVIEDLTLDVAKELLKFIYTGKVESLDTLAEGLLSAADKYGLELLKQICGQYLVGQVTTENAARLFALADRHSVEHLKRTSMLHISGHFADVMLTQDWSRVEELVVEEMRQLTLKEMKTMQRSSVSFWSLLYNWFTLLCRGLFGKQLAITK